MQFLDAETRRELGFDDVWLRIRPVSPLGRAQQRQAEAYLPERASELEAALSRLEDAAARLRADTHAAHNLLYFLSNLRDITTIIERCARGDVLDDAELYEVKRLLLIAAEIQAELERLGWMGLLPAPVDLCAACLEALSVGQGRQTSFYIADAYDGELAAVRRRRIELEEQLAGFRSMVNEKIQRATDRILSMEDEITVSRAESGVVERLEDIKELTKIQDTTDFVTFRLVEGEEHSSLRRELGTLRAREEACKARIRKRLSETVAAHAPKMLGILEILGFLDFLLAKARFCVEIRGVRPKLCTSPRLAIGGGRHLLVEEEVERGGGSYCPLSLELRPGVTLITGPNMGGKTVSLKTIGLLTAMAQYGLLVPAVSMELRPRRFIRAHLASRVVQGLSKFAGEMNFVRHVLAHSHEDGLILLDELAHGTNPAEGAAVAQAVVERLCGEPTISVITTHYPSLGRVEGVFRYKVRGLRRELLEGQESVLSTHGLAALQRLMDYALEPAEPGELGQSDAVLVAEALGLEPEIIERAKVLQRSDGHG